MNTSNSEDIQTDIKDKNAAVCTALSCTGSNMTLNVKHMALKGYISEWFQHLKKLLVFEKCKH